MIRPLGTHKGHIVAPYPFLWNKSYSLGHEELDAKHAEVFRSINHLLQAENITAAADLLRETIALFQCAFDYEENLMESLVAQEEELMQRIDPFKSNEDDSWSSLGSVSAKVNRLVDDHGEPMLNELTQERMEHHVNKHRLFLEDLESIRRRLDFSNNSTRYDQDADARGRRELEYITVSPLLTPSSHRIATIDHLQQALRNEDRDMAMAKRANMLNDKLLLNVDNEPVNRITQEEMEVLRHQNSYIFTRDWLAQIQRDFMVGICLLHISRTTRVPQLIMANAVWTEFTHLYPWIAAKSQLGYMINHQVDLDIADPKPCFRDAFVVSKNKILTGDIHAQSPLFSMKSCDFAVFSYFGGHGTPSSIDTVLQMASHRQREKLLSTNFLGPLEDQTLSENVGALPWQHVPVGQRLFDSLMGWMTGKLIEDAEWVSKEFPNVTLSLPSSVAMTIDEDTSAVVKDVIISGVRVGPVVHEAVFDMTPRLSKLSKVSEEFDNNELLELTKVTDSLDGAADELINSRDEITPELSTGESINQVEQQPRHDNQLFPRMGTRSPELDRSGEQHILLLGGMDKDNAAVEGLAAELMELNNLIRGKAPRAKNVKKQPQRTKKQKKRFID